MPIGLLDLSIVTDRLIREVRNAVNTTSQLWVEGGSPGSPAPRPTITVTGLAPDVARDEADCQLSIYLFHVAPEPYNRNMYLRGGARARTVPELALPLTLHYLVTAHSPTSYVAEQQAMSVALKWFHEHPTLEATVPLDGRVESMTMSLAAEGVDEIGRIWQAINVPMRLSAVYRVAVMFIEPVERTVEPKRVERLDLDVEPLAQLPPTVASASLVGAVITVTGSDFVAGELEVRFRGKTLVSTAAAVGPGEYRRLTATTIELQPHDALTAGHYPIWIGRKGLPVTEAWVEVP